MNLHWDKYDSIEGYVIDEISNFIRDNIILLLRYNDDCLINIRKYCRKKSNEENIKILSYSKLLYFTEEVLGDLINTDYLYDLRDLDQG